MDKKQQLLKLLRQQKLLKLLKQEKAKNPELVLKDIKQEAETKLFEIEETVKTLKGDKGEKGDTGEQGIQGEKGDKGDKGDPGKNGIDGINGKDGKNGIDGKDGIDGLNGLNGKDAELPDLKELAINTINTLETFEGDDRLDIKAVKGFETFADDVKNRVNKVIESLDNHRVLGIKQDGARVGQANELNFIGATIRENGEQGVDIVIDDARQDLWQNNDTSISPLSTTKDVVLDTNILKATTAQVNSLTGTNSASIGKDIKFYNTGILRTHATITYNNKFYGVAYTDKKIYVIDPVAGTLTSSTFTTTSTVIGQVVELGGYLYAIGDKSIIKFDPTTLSATTILVQNFGGIPSITTDGTYLYAVGYTSTDVFKINTSGSVVSTLNVGYSNMHWIGYDSSNNVLLITTGQSPSSWIVKVDVSTFTFLDSASFLGTATDDNAIVSSNGYVYIGVEGSNNFIWKYEIADLANVSQIAMPHASYGLFYFGGNELYCGANLSNTITILDLVDEVYTEYPMYETLNAAVNEIQLVNGYIMNTMWGYNGVWARKTLPTSNTAPVWNNQVGTTDLGNTSTYDLTAIGNTNLSGNVDVGGYYHQNLSDPIDDAFHIYDALNDKTYARLDMLKNTMYFSPQVHIGENTDWEGDTKTPLNVGGNIDNFSQIIVKNINNGNNASSDLVAAASDDTTTALGHFTDVGILSPNYTTTSDGIVKNIMISNYGSGYTNGDIITISGGDNNCTVQLTVSGGVVVDWTIIDSGTGYSITKFAYPTTGGTGTDLTVNVIGLVDNNLYSPGDGYIFTSGGNLVISSEKEKGNSDIVFATDGTGIKNERGRITNDGLIMTSDSLIDTPLLKTSYDTSNYATYTTSSTGVTTVTTNGTNPRIHTVVGTGSLQQSATAISYYGATNNYAYFQIISQGGVGNGWASLLRLQNTDGAAGQLFMADSGAGTAYYVAPNYLTMSTPSGYGIILNTNGTTNNGINITTAGNVGVGTTSGAAKVHTLSTGGTVNYIAEKISEDTAAPFFTYRKSRGTVGSQNPITTSDVMFNIAGSGWNGTTYSTGGSLRMFAQENFTGGSSTYFTVATVTTGTTTNVERIRVNDSGLGVKTLASPNSTLQVNGSVSAGYVAKTANYTLTSSDYTVECTANTFTITLPTAVGITGRIYNIKNSGTGVITINTTSSETIDQYASGAITLAQWDSLQIQSNGASWLII